ncbi:MAG: peptide ABC transporter substrate-binding protein [Gammaproteobacteria bacterium]|nr:peptide ABC transporter substrate-binding protein [Gammaproteobacteria bacterium]
MSRVVFSLVCWWLLASPLQSAETIHLGNPGEPETLDPHRYNLRLEETILTDLFLGLTTFNARGQIVPGAAAAWTTSSDGLTWTFTLRNGLKWSDGKTLTAHDFVYAFRRLLAPETAASLAYFMYPLKNAEAVNSGKLPSEELGARALDDHTLLLSLEAPYPHLPERLLYPTGYPVPKHLIDRVGDAWVKPKNWVSNGAYRLEDWQPQSHVTLVKNDYFFEPVEIERVSYHPLANEQSAYNRYRAREIHAISSFPSGELDRVRKDFASHLRLSPLLSIVYLVFNTTVVPFEDTRVRQALALVVDADLITVKVQRSGNVANGSFVPANVVDYTPAVMPHLNLNRGERRETALRLLREAGYGPDNPLRVTMRYVSGTEAKKTQLAIASFWKNIGVETQLHHAELKVHFADLRQGDFQVAQAGWFGENNAEHYLGLLVSDTGNVNYGRYANPEYDALMHAARQKANVKVRNVLLRKAEAVGIAEYPVIPLYSVMIRRLVDPAITGWHENSRDTHPVRFLGWR